MSADAVGAQDPDRDPVAAGARGLRLDAAPVWIVAAACDAAGLVVVAHGRLRCRLSVFGNRVSDSGRCRSMRSTRVVFGFGLASSFLGVLPDVRVDVVVLLATPECRVERE